MVARLKSPKSKAKPKPAKKRAAPSRKYDPEKTKRDILSVATKEFAKHGYNGARIDAIAARTSTTKRMIYYYFGGKERLYIAVLEREYARIRAYEAGLHLESARARAGDPAGSPNSRSTTTTPSRLRAPGRDREYPSRAPPRQVEEDPQASTRPSSTPSTRSSSAAGPRAFSAPACARSTCTC